MQRVLHGERPSQRHQAAKTRGQTNSSLYYLSRKGGGLSQTTRALRIKVVGVVVNELEDDLDEFLRERTQTATATGNADDGYSQDDRFVYRGRGEQLDIYPKRDGEI